MIDSTGFNEYEDSPISTQDVPATIQGFLQRDMTRLAREEELRSRPRKTSFSKKQEKARRHTATIFKLLQQSRLCTSCGGKLDNDGLFSVRPHLICDENGQRLICGKCHREGDHGEPIRAFMHGTY